MRYVIKARARNFDGEIVGITWFAEDYTRANQAIQDTMRMGWWENGSSYYPPAAFDSAMRIEEIEEEIQEGIIDDNDIFEG